MVSGNLGKVLLRGLLGFCVGQESWENEKSLISVDGYKWLAET